jgi:hypothetical protein
MAMAALNNVLVHSALLPIPKNDAHVAFAAGADPNPALAKSPPANAPATSAPDIFRFVFTILGAIMWYPNPEENDHVNNTGDYAAMAWIVRGNNTFVKSRANPNRAR